MVRSAAGRVPPTPPPPGVHVCMYVAGGAIVVGEAEGTAPSSRLTTTSSPPPPAPRPSWRMCGAQGVPFHLATDKHPPGTGGDGTAGVCPLPPLRPVAFVSRGFCPIMQKVCNTLEPKHFRCPGTSHAIRDTAARLAHACKHNCRSDGVSETWISGAAWPGFLLPAWTALCCPPKQMVAWASSAAPCR